MNNKLKLKECQLLNSGNDNNSPKLGNSLTSADTKGYSHIFLEKNYAYKLTTRSLVFCLKGKTESHNAEWVPIPNEYFVCKGRSKRTVQIHLKKIMQLGHFERMQGFQLGFPMRQTKSGDYVRDDRWYYRINYQKILSDIKEFQSNTKNNVFYLRDPIQRAVIKKSCTPSILKEDYIKIDPNHSDFQEKRKTTVSIVSKITEVPKWKIRIHDKRFDDWSQDSGFIRDYTQKQLLHWVGDSTRRGVTRCSAFIDAVKQRKKDRQMHIDKQRNRMDHERLLKTKPPEISEAAVHWAVVGEGALQYASSFRSYVGKVVFNEETGTLRIDSRNKTLTHSDIRLWEEAITKHYNKVKKLIYR